MFVVVEEVWSFEPEPADCDATAPEPLGEVVEGMLTFVFVVSAPFPVPAVVPCALFVFALVVRGTGTSGMALDSAAVAELDSIAPLSSVMVVAAPFGLVAVAATFVFVSPLVSGFWEVLCADPLAVV